LEAFIASTGLVALAEIGDKTQLLALALATRYRKPVPILAGIFLATLVNHALAGAAGAWLVSVTGPDIMRWALACSFLAMGAWMLVPDELGDTRASAGRWGVLATTCVAFFIVEIGDKTQIATVALAAKYASFYAVVSGTTIGMLLANAPVVLLGHRLTTHMPVRLVHRIAAALFIAIGVLTLLYPA
jgi:putative Ca2+/H+ antiporter (TMEM165/GDT1 family)